MEAPAGLSLTDLVTLEQDVEPYIMDWPVIADEDGEPEVSSLVISKRAGGFLAAVPVGFIPEEVLAAGNTDQPPGPVGPSTVLQVSAVVLDNGNLHATGTSLSVVVVDLQEEVVAQMRLPEVGEHYPFTYDVDQPFAIPSPPQLLAATREWVSAGAGTEGSAMPYFSAEEGGVYTTDAAEEEEGLPTTPRARRKQKHPPGPERPTGYAKKPTVASLAASMEQLLAMNEGLVKSVESLAGRQKALEQRAAPAAPPLQAPSQHPHQGILRQPISTSLQGAAAPLGILAQHLPPPPRTQAPTASGLLASPQFQPPDLLELEDEKRAPDPGISSDHLAKAVLAQSQALTALVSQIAQQGGDPMLDLSSSAASASTRGAQGRAKLQGELASQRGVFFQAVLASMARRMQPTASPEGSPQELLDRGVCGTRYLERFGGYGRVRELGCLQQQMMSIMDCLQASNWQAARDQTALLAVTIDQAALDQGRFELANLLCLQEEPPATVFSARQMNVLNKPRAFSQLADQKWVTVALAYIKELDVITSKRLELTSQSKHTIFGGASSDSPGNPFPKPKPGPKKKGRGGGKGGWSNVAADGEEA